VTAEHRHLVEGTPAAASQDSPCDLDRFAPFAWRQKSRTSPRASRAGWRVAST
jgi:hypothetical protein